MGLHCQPEGGGARNSEGAGETEDWRKAKEGPALPADKGIPSAPTGLTGRVVKERERVKEREKAKERREGPSLPAAHRAQS